MGLGLNAIPSVCVADEVQLTNRDPRWVGAWWLGFLVAASLVAVSAVPYFFFPREMPKEVGGGLRVVPVALHTNVLPQGRMWCMGTVGVGQRLDLMVLKVFSKLHDSVSRHGGDGLGLDVVVLEVSSNPNDPVVL